MKNMKNYKIIENRPELTPEQISQGMNFAAVKSGAAGAGKAFIKTASLKGIVIKSVIAIAVLSTTTLICYKIKTSDSEVKNNRTENVLSTSSNNTNAMASEKQTPQIFIGDTTIEPEQKKPEQHSEEKKSVVESLTVTSSETPTHQVSDAVLVKDSIQKQEQKNTKYTVSEPFKPSPNAKCILLSMDALDNMGSAVPSPITMNCNACEFGYINTSELEKRSQLKMVWLSVKVDGKSKFNLESELKNISLIKGSGNKHLHPIAIGIGAPSGNSGEGKFISDKFRAIDLKIIFNKQVDVYLFFEEAAVGDRIIFDDFVQAQIEE